MKIRLFKYIKIGRVDQYVHYKNKQLHHNALSSTNMYQTEILSYVH